MIAHPLNARWMVRGGITGLFALAMLAAVSLPLERYLLLVAAMLAVSMATLALTAQLHSPRLGMTLLLASAVVVPVEVSVGPSTISACVGLTAFLCGAWYLRLVLVQGTWSIANTRATTAALSLMAIAVLAFVCGQYPWFPTPAAPLRAQTGGLAIFLLSGSLFLTVGHQIGSVADLRRLTWWFIGLGAIALATSVISVFDVHVGRVFVVNSSSIGSMFWTWFVAIAAGQALFNEELPGPVRALLGLLTALALARGLTVGISWTSGWLPPLVTVGVLLFIKVPRTTIGAALLLIVPALILSGPAIDALMRGEHYSLVTRIEALKVMGTILSRNPILGFGPANYYYYSELFPILGWYVRFNSHNNYVDLLAQTGVVGMVAFWWFVAEAVAIARRLRRRTSGGFTAAYATAALAGLAGSLVAACLADWILPFTYNIGLKGFRSSLLFWFFLGGLLALHRLSAAQPSVEGARSRRPHMVLVRA